MTFYHKIIGLSAIYSYYCGYNVEVHWLTDTINDCYFVPLKK